MTAAKRFVFPFILALAIHGFLLSMDGNWMKVKPVLRPVLAPLTISLHMLVPPKPPAGPVKTVKDETRYRKTALPPRPVQKEKEDTAFKQTEIKPAGPVPIQPKPLPVRKKKKKVRAPQKALLKKPAPVDDPRPPSATAPPKTVTTAGPDIPPPLPQSIREIHPEHGVPDAGTAHQKSADLEEPPPATSPPPENLKEAHPLYQYNPPPRYPRRARKRGYQGTVILAVLVTTEGKAGRIKVFQSSGRRLLDEAAILSVKKWRFEPGRKGDIKLDMWVKIPIRYQLEK